MALNLNASTRAKLERFMDGQTDPSAVARVIEFFASLDAAERIFAGEWMRELAHERWMWSK